VRTTRAEGGD